MQVLNMYANDGLRLFLGATWVVHTASGPLMLIAGTACAIAVIGAWALIGFAILLLIIFLQVRMMKPKATYRLFFPYISWENVSSSSPQSALKQHIVSNVFAYLLFMFVQWRSQEFVLG